MKIEEKDGELIVTTRVFQARNGAIWIDWGNTAIKLEKDYTYNVARDIPDFDQNDYNNYYR